MEILLNIPAFSSTLLIIGLFLPPSKWQKAMQMVAYIWNYVIAFYQRFLQGHTHLKIVLRAGSIQFLPPPFETP